MPRCVCFSEASILSRVKTPHPSLKESPQAGSGFSWGMDVVTQPYLTP